MSVVYGLIEETYGCVNETRISYGIAAFASETNHITLTVVASVHDITDAKQNLQTLIHLCNQLELSPIHLNDVVQDFFYNS